MGLETSAVDRALHLALFVLGAIAFAVGALAVLERVGSDRDKRSIRAPHVAIPVAAFAAVGIAERIFHAVH